MLRKFTGRICAGALSAFLFALPTANLGNAQFTLISSNTRTQTVSFTVTLRPPNYHDALDVARHLAYSTILTALLKKIFNAHPQQECRLSGQDTFPDVTLSLTVPTADLFSALQRCAPKVVELLKAEYFERQEFDAAIKNSGPSGWPLSTTRWDLGRWDKTIDPATRRLGYLGELAVIRLYADDPVLKPLREYAVSFRGGARDYAGFRTWLVRQRNYERLGFSVRGNSSAVWAVNLCKEHGEDWLEQRGLKASIPSAFSVPSRPNIDYSKSMSVNSPRFHGHTFMMLRCDTRRDPECAIKAKEVLCRKALEQTVPREITRGTSSTDLRCVVPGYINVAFGWLATDADDPQVLQWVYQEISARRLRTAEFDPALVEERSPGDRRVMKCKRGA